MFALVDCNNFFVSCERAFDSRLEGRGVVVLSNNDGCVVARSNEAKAAGVKMGQPFFQARDLVKRYGIVALSSNYRLYSDMSRRVMTTLSELAPAIEVYSIDEAFLDVSGVDISELEVYGRGVVKTVRRNIGIPVSVGVAPTKTLAKLAAHLAKSYPKLQGACLMCREQDIAKVLAKTPIREVWGIGRRYEKMLSGFGVVTAADFVDRPREWVKARMGLGGVRTWLELKGEACIGMEDNREPQKMVANTRSFAGAVTDFEELRRAVVMFATTGCEKLRKQGTAARRVTVFIATDRHREDRPQYSSGAAIDLPVASDSTLVIARTAVEVLRRIYREGYGYKRAGVILGDIFPASQLQPELFGTEEREKHEKLMKAVDSINAAGQKRLVRLASQGFKNINARREHTTPQYTTNWDDIPVVKV